MKKRILSILFATALILAMSIPASAATISSSGTYNGFLYMTTDSCYTDRYYCVIESNYADYTIATDVTTYSYDSISNSHIAQYTIPGSQSYMISINRANSELFAISQIYCAYKVGGVKAGQGYIPAS